MIELEEDRIRFSHPLLASGVYAAGRPRSGARCIGGSPELVPDPEERARHLALGAEGPEPTWPRRSTRPRTRAHSRGALAAAAELSVQAGG